MNTTLQPEDLQGGEGPYAVNVRLGDGGISSDYNLSRLGALSADAGDKTVIHLAGFEPKAQTGDLLVRMMPAGWDSWDGANWTPLAGMPVNLTNTRRLCHAVMQNKLVVADGINQLQAWDGILAHNVAALSGDAPIAECIVPLGQRLFAARVKLGGSIDPYAVAWCVNDLITDWTTVANGAGSAILEPEGRSDLSDFIMSLSAQETAMVLYRERSIVLGVRTGIGASPLRFTTTAFGLGTSSPDSIASLGRGLGDIFLANDLNVYLFNGLTAPTLLSEPIRLDLQNMIKNPGIACSAFDRKRLKYWLLVDNGANLPTVAWVLDVKEMLVSNRISWRRKDLALPGYASIAYAQTQSGAIPVVNAVPNIVNTVNIIVDDFGVTPTTEGLVLGDGAGGVWYPDASKPMSGAYQTRMLGNANRYSGVDKVFVTAQSSGGGVIEISFSTDGGNTWQQPKNLAVPAGQYALPLSTWFSTVLVQWQFRIRILSGDLTVTEIRAQLDDRGKAAA